MLSTYRLRLLISAIAFIPIGYWVRFHGFGPNELKDALGSVAYEMFWITLALACWPKVLPLKMSSGVFLLTCALEFLQFWQPPFLQAIRATFPGRLVLGNTFSGSDFPAYGMGSFLGYLWANFLAKTVRKS
jgi:Protein of unknown function (DUF2809)